ncbi:MAG: YggT family protein [Candidatus Dadabacteria bacterium]|nr:YggT family protein [Candidatus Dadabacteria bacterium]MYC40897.1 YggT family protein [Candidatus Dadabacteria bacterium]
MEILGGNFLRAVAEVVDILLSVYIWLIVGRAILSWVNPDPYNPIVRFLYSATEPVLGFVRRYMPPLGGSIDLSPIVVLLLIVFIKRAVVNSLFQIAAGL